MSAHKGKPSGKVAETKYDPGIKSSLREKSAPAGAFGLTGPGEITEPELGKTRPDQNAERPAFPAADVDEDIYP